MIFIISPERTKKPQMFREETSVSPIMGLCNLGDLPRRGCAVDKMIAAEETPARKPTAFSGLNATVATETDALLEGGTTPVAVESARSY